MNRMIPDFSKDKAVNSLSYFAEIVFRRLWNKADDFGRYYADTMILKAELFPRKEIRTPDLCRAISGCEDAALLVQYTVNDEKYLQLNNFNQRVRTAKSKFPQPPDSCLTVVGQMSDSCRLEKEDEYEKEEEENNGEKISPDQDIFIFLGEDFSSSKEFSEIWQSWCKYRRERKIAKWVKSTLERKAKEFTKWGVEQTIANIEASISNGWQGIFPDKQRGAKSSEKLDLKKLKEAYKYTVNYDDPMRNTTTEDLAVIASKTIEEFENATIYYNKCCNLVANPPFALAQIFKSMKNQNV